MSRGIAFILLAGVLLALPRPGAPDGIPGRAAVWLPGGSAAAAEVQIETSRFTVDRDTGITTYEDGLIKAGELSLFAAKITLDTARNTFHAEGFVRLETPSVSGTASAVDFDAAAGVATLHDARLFDAQRGLFLEGESVTLREDGSLTLRRCSFTTCPPDVPARWRLSTSELNLKPGELAVAWNPVLSLGPAPVFWLPVMAWPTVQERRTGFLIPELSEDSSTLKRLDLGLRLKVPVFFNLGLEHDLTLTPELIEKRAPALGLEYNYAFRPGQTGRFSAFGLKENNPRDPLDENDILPAGEAALRDPEPARYWVDWRHNERLGEGFRLVLSYRHAGDGQVHREYGRVTEYRPYRTYQATGTHQSAWSGLGVSYEQNADYLEESLYADEAVFTDLERRPQLLPRLFGTAGVQPLGPLGLKLGAALVRFEAPQDLSGRMAEAAPGISLPIPLGRALELRPSLTRRYVSYRSMFRTATDGSEIELDEESFSQGEGTLELRAAFARVFLPGDGGPATLKHRIVPRLILTAREDVPQPYAERVLRGRVAKQLAILRLDNQWLGLDRSGDWSEPAGPARSLGYVNLIQRYNRLREPDAEPLTGPVIEGAQETEAGEPMLPLILEAGITGASFSLGSEFHYHHQLDEVTRAGVGFGLNLSTYSHMSLQYALNEFTHRTPDNVLIPETESFTFGGEAGLGDRLSMGLSGRMNLQDDPPPLGRRVDQALVFMDYHPACYRARLNYQETVQSALEGGTEKFFIERRVWLTFNLRGLVGGRENTPTARTGPRQTGALARGWNAPEDAATPGDCRG